MCLNELEFSGRSARKTVRELQVEGGLLNIINCSAYKLCLACKSQCKVVALYSFHYLISRVGRTHALRVIASSSQYHLFREMVETCCHDLKFSNI